MPEVELILKAENAQYISKVREAQQANQELYNSVEKGTKREKGLIEDIEDEITKLEKKKREAGSTESLEKYNKKLAEAKKDLQEYNKVGLDTTKTQTTLTKSTNEVTAAFNGYLKKLGPVAVALAVVTKVAKETIKAFKDTVLGLNAATYAAQFWQTIGYNIATGNFNMARSFNVAAMAAKQMNILRKEERKEIVEVEKLRTKYNQLYFESADRTESEAEQLKSLNDTMTVHNELIDKEIAMVAQRLRIIQLELIARPKSNKLLDEEAKLQAELITIEGQRYSETKRIEMRRTGLEKSIREDRMRAYMDEIDETLRRQDEFQKLSLKLLDDYLQSQIEKLEGADKLRAQKDFLLGTLRDQLDEMRKAGTLSVEQEAMFDQIAQNIQDEFTKSLRELSVPGKADTENVTKAAQSWIDLFIDQLGIASLNVKAGELRPFKGTQPTKKTIWDIFGLTPEQGKESLEGLSEVADNLVSVYSSITDRMVDEAQRRRELYDTQIAEAQRSLDLETELLKAGYANNVEAKKKEVEDLKKLRADALKDEEKARKAQAAIDTILQLVNMTTASTEVFKSFSKIPIVGIPLAIAMIGTMFAAFATAKSRAASLTKLAEGGYGDDSGVVKGRSHAAGGERFLDHIEVERGERWGVLNRRASDKYGRVFNEIVSSFNKNEMPSFLAPENVNNIMVNNDGSNSRLDKVIVEQKRLNERLGKDTQILITGHRKVIKKGNKIRIVG